jgi:hypothetical protein
MDLDRLALELFDAIVGLFEGGWTEAEIMAEVENALESAREG